MVGISNKYSRLDKISLIIASFGLAVYIALTAMGAHILKDVLEQPEYSRVFSAATTHLMLSCLGLFIIILTSKLFGFNSKISLIFMLLGITFFPFNLLIYFFLKINGIGLAFLGTLAPIGGTMFICAWISLGILIFKRL